MTITPHTPTSFLFLQYTKSPGKRQIFVADIRVLGRKTEPESKNFLLHIGLLCASITCSLLHFILEVIALLPRYGRLLRILHSCTDQTMTKALAGMELTAAQGQIMGFITHRVQPPCSRDIEEAFHLSHPTVSGLLSRLEKKGFIELRTDETDHRCKRICLLPKGQALNETMHTVICSNEEQLVQGFTDEERELFSQFLTRAIANMGGNPCKRKHKEE